MTITHKCIIASFGHHLDHLVPISFYEKIPLLIQNVATWHAMLEYYPFVESYKMELYPKIQQVNQIISASTSETPMKHFFESYFNKKVDFVRFHHGYSDKPQDFSLYDTILSYKDFPNHRLRFYEEHKSFLCSKIKQVLQKKEHPFLLIALSWDNPKVHDWLECLCRHPKKELFMFRFHPLIAERELVHLKYQARYGIDYIPHEIPYIYPILEMCDGVLTDYSSIGYDALYFEKPLMVLEDVPLKKYSCNSIDTWIDMCEKKGRISSKERYFEVFGNYLNNAGNTCT
jgi:hypothetical protein